MLTAAVGGADTGGVKRTGVDTEGVAGEQREPRAWLGVYFECCHAYGRMYKNDAGTRYVGQCPRCGRPVRAIVGVGGTSQRFFRAE